MKVLVIGSGGREHTLTWKLAASPGVEQLYWAPGNLAATVDQKVTCIDLKADDIGALLKFALENKIDLTVVGPEGPLVAGLGDEFRKAGLAIFGPSKSGAQLEGSKVFSKRFFLKHNIPTAPAEFFTDYAKALAYGRSRPKPIVVKADGIAAGKGVIICQDDLELEKALQEIMVEKIFGDAGKEVLIEKCISGPEVSVHAITDGTTYKVLVSAQDHKRARDGDQGPNTGGMGTYSPTPLYTPELDHRVRLEIFDRTLAGLKADGIPYCGVLYAGIMITVDGPMILEYNCRFGDPETQVILPRLKSDLAEALLAACHGKLNGIDLGWHETPAVCIVLAAGGYPSSFHRGDRIEGLARAGALPHVHIFHAGTKKQGDEILTSGGRVLGVTALGKNLREAVDHAYSAADQILFDGKFCRRDIAARAL